MSVHESLVKYDNAILISNVGGKQKKGKKGGEKSALPPLEGTTQTEDILNSILPPREWTEDNQLWVQYVSSTPATRLDVINLQEHLDRKLQNRQARETGICPVREELYAQTFDELIRQITINCAERGLLLLRVRDEARLTVKAYQTLYESSIAFGMRKALMAEYKRSEMEQAATRLSQEKQDLERQAADYAAKCEALLSAEASRRAADEAKHTEDIERLKGANMQLKTNLEAMLSAPPRK